MLKIEEKRVLFPTSLLLETLVSHSLDFGIRCVSTPSFLNTMARLLPNKNRTIAKSAVLILSRLLHNPGSVEEMLRNECLIAALFQKVK